MKWDKMQVQFHISISVFKKVRKEIKLYTTYLYVLQYSIYTLDDAASPSYQKLYGKIRSTEMIDSTSDQSYRFI